MDEVLRLWGKNIEHFRIARDMSQFDLAQKLEVTQATVSRWESGLLEPRRSMKIKLARELGADVTILFPLTAGAA